MEWLATPDPAGDWIQHDRGRWFFANLQVFASTGRGAQLAIAFGNLRLCAVAEAISEQRSVTYTTVLSAVQKLEKKGWLEHRTEGRAYVYRAVKEKEDVGAGKLRELLKTVFSGDPRLLLSSLIDEAKLSDAELTELRQLIDERRKGTATKKGRRNG